MKNFEKYEDEIRKFKGDNFCKDFIIPHILKKDDCSGICCSECISRQLLWYLEDYEEPEVDWSQVEVDTPIMVRDSENGDWFKRYFAEYKNGKIYTWDNGHTSWETSRMIEWKYAKLVEDEKECEKPKVDWSKVEVDTPILVRDAKYRRWVKRYFAKYSNGTIFAWTIGCTSRDAHNIMTPWKYAKLAETEE